MKSTNFSIRQRGVRPLRLESLETRVASVTGTLAWAPQDIRANSPLREANARGFRGNRDNHLTKNFSTVQWVLSSCYCCSLDLRKFT